MAANDTKITTLDDQPETTVLTKKAKQVASDSIDAVPNGRVMVTIHEGEGDAGSQAVFISGNGNSVLVPRGTLQSLSAVHLEVLKGTMQTIYETINKQNRERQVPRYAYTVHGPA